MQKQERQEFGCHTNSSSLKTISLGELIYWIFTNEGSPKKP
jgi:hypothetical protein